MENPVDTIIVAIATLIGAFGGAYLAGRMAASAAITATNKQLAHSDEAADEVRPARPLTKPVLSRS